jgi:hypothetical protein
MPFYSIQIHLLLTNDPSLLCGVSRHSRTRSSSDLESVFCMFLCLETGSDIWRRFWLTTTMTSGRVFLIRSCQFKFLMRRPELNDRVRTCPTYPGVAHLTNGIVQKKRTKVKVIPGTIADQMWGFLQVSPVLLKR